MNQHAWCIAGSQARPPQSCDCRFKEIPCLKHWPETKIPRFTRFGSTVTFALARVAAGTDPRKICLLRGVIGSTTVSGTVSWGSSPYGVTFTANKSSDPRGTLGFSRVCLFSDRAIRVDFKPQNGITAVWQQSSLSTWMPSCPATIPRLR